MATLKGIRVNLDKQYAVFAKRIERILQAQSPYRTGVLQRSIRVVANKDGLQIVLVDIPGMKGKVKNYGVFLYGGTGEEKASGAVNNFDITYENLQDRAWNPNPGRGRGGIKPRYFLNISDVIYQQFNDELAEEFAKQYENMTVELILNEF